MQTGRSASNLCNRVDARSLQLCAIECQHSHRLRTHECTYKPLVLC